MHFLIVLINSLINNFLNCFLKNNYMIVLLVLFWIFEFHFIYFFMQQVLISHQFYTHQCTYIKQIRGNKFFLQLTLIYFAFPGE